MQGSPAGPAQDVVRSTISPVEYEGKRQAPFLCSKCIMIFLCFPSFFSFSCPFCFFICLLFLRQCSNRALAGSSRDRSTITHFMVARTNHPSFAVAHVVRNQVWIFCSSCHRSHQTAVCILRWSVSPRFPCNSHIHANSMSPCCSKTIRGHTDVSEVCGTAPSCFGSKTPLLVCVSSRSRTEFLSI